MASSQNTSLLQCTGCHEELNLQSKTLPCLHSFCRPCLGSHFKGDTDGNSQCPECQEPLTLDQLRLSPFLINYFRRRLLESTDWKCNLCPNKDIEPTVITWCDDCQKPHCAICSGWHNTFHPEHNTIDLDGIERCGLMNVMMGEVCSLHHKVKSSYCVECDVCFCDACYKSHPVGPPGCSSQPLSVWEEASKRRSQIPTLTKEMLEIGESLRSLNEKTSTYTEELISECKSKCENIWRDSNGIIENIKQKTSELCKDMRVITDEQVKRWRHLLKENERILKQLKVWHLNLQHLLSDCQQDVDVVRGLRMLGSKLSSGRLHKKTQEKCHLGLTSSNWWLEVLKQLKTEMIGSVSLTRENMSPPQNFIFEKQWNLTESINLCRIGSIHVFKEDNHVFLCDCLSCSIIEIDEGENVVCECPLLDRRNKLQPLDMCQINSEICIAVCGYENKLIILQRRTNPSSLTKQIIQTKNQYVSVCQRNELIFVCDRFFQIDSITKEGKIIKNIKLGEDQTSYCPYRYYRIRFDSSGFFWATELNPGFPSELIYFDSNGKKIRSMKTEQKISDFSLNKMDLFFCNEEGIFSLSTKEMIYQFEEESEVSPRIFVLENKILVYLQINRQRLIKIFKMFY